MLPSASVSATDLSCARPAFRCFALHAVVRLNARLPFVCRYKRAVQGIVILFTSEPPRSSLDSLH